MGGNLLRREKPVEPAIRAERTGRPWRSAWFVVEAPKQADGSVIAGFAGAIQVLGVHHSLIPNISSGIGLLGLLVVPAALGDLSGAVGAAVVARQRSA